MKNFNSIHSSSRLVSSRLVSKIKWRLAVLFMVLTSFSMFGQNNNDSQGNAHLQVNSEEKIEFNVRLDAFVDSCLKDDNHLSHYTEQRHTYLEHEEGDILSLARAEAKCLFIQQNLEEYKHLFIASSRSMTLPDVCDNGGFEQDFLHYEGFVSEFTYGSDTCSPHNSMGPSFFIPATLPTSNRFEIVTSGIDPLVGINQTKFGDKALRINNRYGHIDSCDGDWGIDKITKKFIVTSTNQVFTLWYAVVLENPVEDPHVNVQPFLNIKCDLAPADELCYAANFVDCDSTYTDSLCISDFDPLDVIDWTCHRFRIDSTYIGDTATLEIIVADCGFEGHFGYAYIDGICEECDGGTFGSIILDSINYFSCDENVAHICGRYTPPEICNQNWWLDSIMINGYTITEIAIDTGSHRFCFDVHRSNFGSEFCLDLYISGRFTNGTVYLPIQTSNDIEICKSNYLKPSLDFEVSGCMDNTPDPGTANNNISDDYYFVTVDIGNVSGLAWTIERTLVDPYPNEQDTREIADGTGNTQIELGPFRIQEGGWLLTLYVSDSCEYVEYIEPPAYCSGCDKFFEVEISNVQCFTDNTWSFDIEVPGETTGGYYLNATNYDFNEIYTIDELDIAEGCLKYTLIEGMNCNGSFIICPPKPCSTTCNLEVYVEDVPCTKDEYDDITYYVDLEVLWPPSKYACYEATDVDGNSLDDGPLPSPQQVGPYDEDIFLTIKVCNSSCSPTAYCPCYKTIYVPVPDCIQGEPLPLTGTFETKIRIHGDVFVQPNPTHSGEIIIYSRLPRTEYEIIDVHGKRILLDSFTGKEHRQSLQVPSGLYFLKYRDMIGHGSVLKIIKQ